MAAPQLENGYTKVANEIVEALIRATGLSGQELRLSLLVIRKTYGFSKKEDAISLSQMCKNTGLSKTRCSQVINSLQSKRVITVTENINGIGKKYKFNKNYEEWNTVTEKCNRYRKTNDTVTEKRNPPLRKSVTTKDILTKETITKEIIPAAYQTYLEVLKSIPGYPFDEKTDLAFLQEKEKDYPLIDILALLKGWKAYLADKPLNGKSKPRGQLHNQFELAMKWGKHQKPKLLPKPSNILDRINEAERKVNSELSA